MSCLESPVVPLGFADIYQLQAQKEVVNQSHLLRKWVNNGRSDYQSEVQFCETHKLSSQGTNRFEHEGLTRKIMRDCSLENEKASWHRRTKVQGLNSQGRGRKLDTGEKHLGGEEITDT